VAAGLRPAWHDHRVIWLALLVAVLVAVATAAAVLGRVDGSLAEATTTSSHVPLPDDGLTPGDLEGLRFDTALRGYRMSQVDAVIDRLRREIVDLEDRLGDRGEGTVLPVGAHATYSRPGAEVPEASADPDAAPRTEGD
jgi:DivIVA domain-containing protein